MNKTIKFFIAVFLAFALALVSCAGGGTQRASGSSDESRGAGDIGSAVSAFSRDFESGGEKKDPSGKTSNISEETPKASEEGSGGPEESHLYSEESGIDDPANPAYLRAPVYFEDILYENPDYDAAYSHMETISSALASDALPDTIKDLFEELSAFLWWAETEYAVLSIMQSNDITNVEIADETVLQSENLNNVKKRYYELARTLLDSSAAEMVFADWTDEEIETVAAAAALFDDEYVALMTQLTKYENMYIDNLSLTVILNGKEMTLGEVLENHGQGAYLQGLNAVCGDIYLAIVNTYKIIADKAGSDDFAAFAYTHDYRRDYTKEDSRRLREYVKRHIAPIYAQKSAEVSRYAANSVSDPFDNEEVLRAYFGEVSEDMLAAYDYLKEFGLYSIGDDDKMQSGAYTTYLSGYDVPFIFQHTSGSYGDLQTFIHEFGHFYAFYLYGDELPFLIDIDEIHSQANELLFLPYFEYLYGPGAAEQITAYELVNCLGSIVSSCIFDEFESAVFAGDYHGTEELNALFASICREYHVPWVPEYNWSMVQHLFLYPFYYISYAVSLIPALQIYTLSIQDREKGVALYNELMFSSLYYRGFLDTGRLSGFANPFHEDTILDLARTLAEIIG